MELEKDKTKVSGICIQYEGSGINVSNKFLLIAIFAKIQFS